MYDLETGALASVTAASSTLYTVPLRRRLRNFIWQFREQGAAMALFEALDQLRRLTLGAPSRRFTRVTPSLYVGGQHRQHGMASFARRGISAVLNLRAESDDIVRGCATEQYLHLPVIDRTPPTLEQLEQGVAFINEQIASGGTVYIHCREGVGRAPTMAAAYLVSTGMTPNDAWMMIRAVRPFIRPTPMQVRQIELFAARLQAS